MIETRRLVLRDWSDEDLEPFAELNADPEVMEYYPSVLTREQSDAFAARIQASMAEQGWGLWALSPRDSNEFFGYVGLNQVRHDLHFTPAVEIGWRLARPYWGQGYATEAALAVLAFGFENLQLGEIVSYTSEGNLRSRAVMERLGMHRDPRDDFEHPKLPDGHPLKVHVLYRLLAIEWRKRCGLSGLKSQDSASTPI